MKLIKRDAAYIHDLAGEPALKGACLLLEGALHAVPEQDELPASLLACLPAVVLCKACDAYLERLLNERGVAVATPLDPINALPEGSDVDVDLAAGALTEQAGGRRFALRPLHAALVREIRGNA